MFQPHEALWIQWTRDGKVRNVYLLGINPECTLGKSYPRQAGMAETDMQVERRAHVHLDNHFGLTDSSKGKTTSRFETYAEQSAVLFL